LRSTELPAPDLDLIKQVEQEVWDRRARFFRAQTGRMRFAVPSLQKTAGSSAQLDPNLL